VRFFTVPWAPGLERQQLERGPYVALRSTAVIWQLGIRKGFGREVVKARLASEPSSSSVALALELGMLEEECSGLAEEFGK
jgi:hypothetical protein